MHNLFTKENISFVLGLIGSIGTAVGIMKTFINNRTNFSIQVIKFLRGSGGVLTYLMFINHSHSSLVITSLSLLVDNVYYPAVLTPFEASRTTRKENGKVTGVHSQDSISFPIVLSGQFATSGYVYFPLPQGTSVPDAKMFSVKVCTSNGMAVEKLLELDAHH